MRALSIAAVLLCSTAAQAHNASDSYLTMRTGGARLAVRWDIALRDLEQAIGLDGDGDGAITWGEVRLRQEAIAAYALARLQVDGDGRACSGGPVQLRIDHHTDGAYAVLRFALACAGPPSALTLRYGLFFDFDPQHRGLLRIVDSRGSRTLLFAADQPLQRVDLAAADTWHTARRLWLRGAWHVWGGVDHVLFLLVLLLPAVLRRRPGSWRPLGRRDAVVETVKVVAAFTLAHSITLSLAALDLVHPGANWIQMGIAASVVLAALNNAWPILADGRWLMGFGLGLVHGFGFAHVFANSALPLRSLALGLAAFNAGVETGQLAIVAAFLPLAYLARRSWLYQRLVLVGGSSAIAGLAIAWVVECAGR